MKEGVILTLLIVLLQTMSCYNGWGCLLACPPQAWEDSVR